MGFPNLFSGSSARRTAFVQAGQQQSLLNRQKELADDDAATSLQDILERDTKRLMRIYGTRATVAVGRPLNSMVF